MVERLSLGTEQSGILILTGYFEALLSGSWSFEEEGGELATSKMS